MTTLSVRYVARGGSGDPVRLQGALTAVAGAALLDWLQARSPVDAVDVTIDCSRLTDVDRHGADALLDAYAATTLRAGTFVLAGLTPHCRAALEAFGVLAVVESPPTTAADRPARRPA